MEYEIKVSVIIPIYNSEKYLSQCIESIQRQTCKKIEIICVNDCSCDRSVQLLEQYAKQDERIRIINNSQNRGAGYCRNVGIKTAKGKYIVFVDSDDYCEPDMIKDNYICCEKWNLDLVLCEHYKWNETEKRAERIYLNWTIRGSLRGVFSWKDIKYHIFESWLWVPWNRMYKRDFLVNNQLFFSEIDNSEDIYFNSIAMVVAKRIYATDKAYYFYRCNTENQLSRNLDNNIFCTINELEKLQNKLKEKGIYNDVKKSYYNLAVSALHNSLVNLRADSQKELYCYYQTNGFKRLGLPLDKPMYFYELKKYENLVRVWKNPFKEKNGFLQIYSDVQYYQLCKERLEFFFKQLNARGIVTVWGAGSRGAALEQILDNPSEKISFFVDKNPEKCGKNIGMIPVYSYKDKKEEMKQIVVLNKCFWEDIIQQIKEMSPICVKVYDLQSYLAIGLESVDMCMQIIME